MFAKGEAPAKIGEPEYGVVNSARRDTGGKHWVCYANPKNSRHVIYFDSFGMAPPPELVKYLKTSGKQVVGNTGKIQDITAESCGFWCVHALKQIHKGVPFSKFLSKFNTRKQEENEDKLEDVYE